MEQDDALDKLIARWKRIHYNRSIVPPVAGLLFLAMVLPLFFTVCNGGEARQTYVANLILFFSILLFGFLGVASLQWRFECNHLLVQMLQHDDLRLIPILIHALDTRYVKYFEPVSKRLTLYLDRMTVDDSALLSEKEYTQLHSYLFYHSAYDLGEEHDSLQIALLRVIQRMGHISSIGTVKAFIWNNQPSSKSKADIQEAANECLATLLELREQAKHDSTLLRPSQQEAIPETLLRAAMPTVPDEDNLLKPIENPINGEKNHNLTGQ